MNSIFLNSEHGKITQKDIRSAFSDYFDSLDIKKVLILPPDISRMNSYAGPIVQILYQLFYERGAKVQIMPALGTHVPMEKKEIDEMYPGIPLDAFLVHNWREDVETIGIVPADFVEKISEGYYNEAVPVQINRRLLDQSYDVIISVGQVVPHEVVGMANYTKNVFVGCGGREIINKSHYIGALYGMEKMMGRDHSPVHQLFDYAQEHFLKKIPLVYALTVTTTGESGTQLEALSIGEKRDIFEKAIKVSQKKNLTFLDAPLKKVVVFLDEKEFKTTWIGNKAIYRTRMAIADGGELLIIAPGLHGCGEDAENDRLIRKYGYIGRDKICRLTAEQKELQDNLSVAAHIIHSSSENRFQITYAPGHMTKEEIESINYGYVPLAEALKKYSISTLKPGINLIDGEEVFIVKNPAVGLWALKQDFQI